VKPALFVPIVVAAHILLTTLLFRLSPSWTAVLAAGELRTRLGIDAAATIGSMVMAYVLLATFIVRQGRRYIRVRTEIALARDIHRLLVPPIVQRVGRFEFRGFSIPSGEVGGDLVDLVHEGDRWIGYVADVSGHGVASGLLMAMVKSSVRMKLRQGLSIATLMDDLNSVLMNLKKPEMYVTFACVHFDGTVVQFSLAGHLPILHYQSVQSSIAELSVPQIPIAMFEEQRFTADRVGCEPGDLFVIVTDGLVEVFDKRDRESGFDRLKALVVEQRARAAGDKDRRSVSSGARAWSSGGRPDDACRATLA
jgi:sigma-B regulation protein RsbU (phosphoserine phosphatase)